MLSGGVLAHKGLLPFWGVVAAAVTGSFVVDQAWFLTGRFLRDRGWVRRLTRRAGFGRAMRMVERHPTPFILAFRFLYGLRTVSPIAIGASRVPIGRFVALNGFSAVVWGASVSWIGYRLGGLPLWAHVTRRPAAMAVGVAAVLLTSALVWRGFAHARRA